MALQPTLPAEAAYTDAEIAFIDLSPPGLWPDNQDSNFGQFRRVVTDITQACIDKVDRLSDEMFIATAVDYLSLWEEMTGIPVAPVGKTDADRRVILTPQVRYGPFTRARLKAMVEKYLVLTFGAAASFTPSGIPLTAGGVPLFSGVSSLTGAYRIYEDVRNFSYEVWVVSSLTPDIASLTKELNRVTPAGITVTFDNSHADVLDYARTVKNKQPVWFSRLSGNANDVSGYANNGTVNGAPAALASPGLLVNPAGGSSAGYDFDGVNDYISVPHVAQMNVGDTFSLEAWVKFDALTGNPRIVSKGGSAMELYVTATGELRLQQPFTAVILAHGANLLTTGVTYHIVATKDGAARKLYVNGVDVTVLDSNVTLVDNSNALEIGRLNGSASNWLDAKIDEVGYYNTVLSPAQVLENYNTGRDIA